MFHNRVTLKNKLENEASIELATVIVLQTLVSQKLLISLPRKGCLHREISQRDSRMRISL